MDIQELGALGELVGGVAVIATLVYLAIQTRHSLSEARRAAASSDEGSLRFPLQLCRMTESAENVGILKEGLHDFASLTPDQAGRFNTLLLGLFVAFVTVFDFHRQDMIPLDEFEASQANFLRFLLTPGGRQWWDQTKNLYPRRGVEHVESTLAACTLEPITKSWSFLSV